MTPETPITPETAFPDIPETNSGNSGISIDTGFPESAISGALPRHPLGHETVVKIALGETASKALEAIGPHVLVIATPADATAPPELRGRMVLHCMPIPAERADDAYRVAKGLSPAKAPRGRAKSPKAQNPTPFRLISSHTCKIPNP